MDPLSQVIAGIEGAVWRVSWAPLVPLDPKQATLQLAAGGLAVPALAGAMPVGIV